MRTVAMAFTLLQAILAIRVFLRMVRTAGGRRIDRFEREVGEGAVTVLVPVLNEANRLEPCLAGLVAQGPEVGEILVIDGGSTDCTRALVRQWSRRDCRIRLVDASPVPDGVNGKAYGLQVGLDRATGPAWVLTVDADVRPDAHLVRSLLAHARAERVPALSVATRQRLSGTAEGLIHPAMLTTLVYRFGIPGHATRDPAGVQANGQCFLVRRDVLHAIGGFVPAMVSVCEDVTLARAIAHGGWPVGFYETDGLVSVEMYAGWHDAWENWSRSLPMRDHYAGWRGRIGLAEILLIQAGPLWLAILYQRWLGRSHPVTMLNAGLLCARIGVLCGTARAYTQVPWTYWLSPLTDLAVALRLVMMWRRRWHRWRGRGLYAGDVA